MFCRSLLTLIASFISISILHAQKLDIEKMMSDNKIICLGLGAIKNGAVEYVNVYGELKEGVKAPNNTIFNVASMTKPVIALLTLKLVNDKKWSLDEPLAAYFTDPDVALDPRHKQLTTRHVLTHQTGFVNWRWIHPTKKLTFDSDPGTKFGYSGEGFEYLKNALESKFKISLEELVREHVFIPLQMNDSRLTWNDSVESRYAVNHDREGKAVYKTVKRTEASAADDMLTTVEDYTKFCIAVINGFGLNKVLFADLVKPHVKMQKNVFMGLGLQVVPGLKGNECALVHSGSDEGVRAIAIFNPIAKEGLVYFTNSDNGLKIAPQIFTSLLRNGEDIVKKLQSE